MGLALAISGLAVSGRDSRTLLAVPDLEVAPGSCVAVKGPSGAGKSTFLFACAGLAGTASGSIVWGDTDILALGIQKRAAFRRSAIGLVFQDFLLFEELSALANAALPGAFAPAGAQKAMRLRAASVLERLGIAPLGARTVESFSGGERQRVAIARALASDPDVILADEPTASLDRKAADALVDDLVRLARTDGKTLVAVSHDSAVHERADRVIEIIDGQIASDTTYA
ncbi:ABC transporter ATP-binding protein [Pelagibacterium xiamenense]|uniref:ABC transporter ATP-binding protein n=1 Tax=Pelagibacterium xiamenense TaxID=2901140 RepID=UPI001E393B5B|nr:ATP-binding cassette domain-containing protein [Pelagibacterium xiamenense]MCD7059845.1 ATP-binding cassette domain-containing protein [Pelagibacterium xiamenense]